MKDRKSFKNSYNAMEQELSFQKGLQKKTKTKTKTKTETKTETKTNTKTKTKNEKDPTYAIFLESRGCKDIKYDNFTKMSKTKTKTGMKKTQHVLYFRKAEDATISNMTFSPRSVHEIFEKSSRNLREIFEKSSRNLREIFEKSSRNPREILEKS